MGETNHTHNQDSALAVSLTVGELRALIREEVQAVHQTGQQAGDRLLDVDEASKVLCVDEDWLYRHHKKLPFTRKLGPKMLRFSYQGIQKYLATRKNA